MFLIFAFTGACLASNRLPFYVPGKCYYEIKTMENKIIYIALMACAILVSTSIVYYFAWEKPRQDAIKLDLEKQKVEIQKQEQKHNEQVENQKIEADKIEAEQKQAIELQKIQMDQQVIDEANRRALLQASLLDECIKKAENVLKAVLNEACPGVFQKVNGESTTCKEGSSVLMDSAFTLRDETVKDCYRRYPQK